MINLVKYKEVILRILCYYKSIINVCIMLKVKYEENENKKFSYLTLISWCKDRYWLFLIDNLMNLKLKIRKL